MREIMIRKRLFIYIDFGLFLGLKKRLIFSFFFFAGKKIIIVYLHPLCEGLFARSL
jgi:hypothetical protein